MQIRMQIKQRGLIFTILCLAMGLLGNAAFANGKALYTSKGCPACHGPKGGTSLVPNYPKINGQNAPYLVAQLKAFKSQQRKGGQSALMWGLAAQLSEGDMKQIAQWLAKQK